MRSCTAVSRRFRELCLNPCLGGLVLWLCLLLLAFVLVLLAFVQVAFSAGPERSCTTTAQAVLNACKNGARDKYWMAIGNCTNAADQSKREQCLKAAEAALTEALKLCHGQLQARMELCADLGEEAYDPAWDPAEFVEPLEIGAGAAANPYFPLEQGRRWVYRSDEGRQAITVTVTAATKRIGGVTCLVVNHLVVEDGEVVEDTDTWYAQDRSGNVWSCGETAFHFETIDGDQPQLPELVDIGGSWKAFRGSARSGVVMFAAPRQGEVYRHQLAPGTAEDAAEVLSLEGSAKVPAPGASCAGSCLVTRKFTPLEPEAFEHRFYAPGIGLILALDPARGARTRLVGYTAP